MVSFKALPRTQTLAQLDENLMLGRPTEIVDKLDVYARAGIHQFIFNPNFGVEQTETLEDHPVFFRGSYPTLA